MDVVNVWCEWDIGLSECVFASEAVAQKYADIGLKEHGLYDPEDYPDFDSVKEDGLIGFEYLDLIEE